LFIVRFCLLWFLVSAHVVGGAVLFRRLFPRESPWFGFVVPALAFVLVMNFTEHIVAIPTLRPLMPFTTLGSLWLMVSPKTNWRRLRLPAIIFLASFAFTLFLRFLKPDIAGARDGIYDLQFVATFLTGQTLPAESVFIPPLPLIYYYPFGHYACSVLIRLFGLDLGTGFNVSGALLSAWIYFLVAGVAWQVGRRRRWLTILSPILVACGATGASGFLYLTLKDVNPEDTATLYSRWDYFPGDQHNVLYHFLHPIYMYSRHELLVPGFWSWMGIFHSSPMGQFIALVATLAITEMLRPRRADWPWILCAGSVPLMLVASSWGFPYAVVLVSVALAAAWLLRRRPLHPREVLLGLGAIIVGFAPMLLYYLTSSTPPSAWVSGDEHTQVLEFFVQWWPIYLPWLGLLLTWRRVHPAVWVLLIVTPIAFTAVELYGFGARFDMTGKNWGFIFAAAWAVFVPAVATSRSRILRAVFGLIVFNCVLSLFYWMDFYYRTVDPKDVGQLEGKGDLRLDNSKARILNALLPLHNRIITTGKSSWSFCPAARLALFSGNRDYITWSFNCDNDMFRNGVGEGWRREKVLDDFYDGKNPDPLLYLRQRNIDAVVVWPDDNTPDAVLAKLQRQLAPGYQYQDLRELDDHTSPNCGIFLYHPNLLHELPPSLTPHISNDPD
jgi:hypothetical protein